MSPNQGRSNATPAWKIRWALKAAMLSELRNDYDSAGQNYQIVFRELIGHGYSMAEKEDIRIAMEIMQV